MPRAFSTAVTVALRPFSAAWGEDTPHDRGDLVVGWQLPSHGRRRGEGYLAKARRLAGHQPDPRQACQTGEMDDARAAEVVAESAAVLRNAGALFAYLHGSRASGQYRPDSDIDIAAYFGGQPPNAFDILMPPGVDLLVLDHAPLELAGRVAARGRLLFDDDPVSRVRWEATTRKIYFDELPRITRAHREFAASVTGRRG